MSGQITIQPEAMQEKLPDFFVTWAKLKLEQDRETVQYMAQFGQKLEKIIARGILSTAGEGECAGKL